MARAVFRWELRDDVKAEYYQVWAVSLYALLREMMYINVTDL